MKAYTCYLIIDLSR